MCPLYLYIKGMTGRVSITFATKLSSLLFFFPLIFTTGIRYILPIQYLHGLQNIHLGYKIPLQMVAVTLLLTFVRGFCNPCLHTAGAKIVIPSRPFGTRYQWRCTRTGTYWIWSIVTCPCDLHDLGDQEFLRESRFSSLRYTVKLDRNLYRIKSLKSYTWLWFLLIILFRVALQTVSFNVKKWKSKSE